MFKIRSFICILVIFTILFGTSTSTTALLTPMYRPGNFTISQLSKIQSFSTFGALIIGPLGGLILDRT